MSVKIVYTKERIQQLERISIANEAFVRFLQLSLQLYFQWGLYSFTALNPISTFLKTPRPSKDSHSLAFRIHYDQSDSDDDHDIYTNIVLPICLVWIIVNFLSIIFLKCIDELSKGILFVSTTVNYIIGISIALFGFVEDESQANPQLQIYHRYAPFQVLNCLCVVTLFYLIKTNQPKRFSKSPGNFVWVWLFLAWDWHEAIQNYMKWIGVIYLIITLTSIFMVVLQLMKGLTTTVKRIIFLQWAFCLILTAMTEIFAIVSRQIILEQSWGNGDKIAVSLIEIFMIVNILDMLFWIIGRCTM